MRFQTATALFCVAAAVNINEAEEQYNHKPALLAQTGTGFRWMTPQGNTGSTGDAGKGGETDATPTAPASDAKVNINIGRIETLNMQV